MLLLAVFWISWCILHSLLISRRTQRLAGSLFGRSLRFYRLAYIVFSSISLLPVLFYQYGLEQHVLFSWNGPARLIQILFLAYALVFFYFGARSYDLKYFLGLRQIHEGVQAAPSVSFVRHGILAHVRHPWYGGGLAFLWAYDDISDVALVSRSILSLYLVIGTVIEERRLKETIGEPYRRYCREVPMFVPWKLFKPMQYRR